MDSFLETQTSFSQYGFRVNRSTSQAIIESIKETTDAIDDKQQVIGECIDLNLT